MKPDSERSTPSAGGRDGWKRGKRGQHLSHSLQTGGIFQTSGEATGRGLEVEKAVKAKAGGYTDAWMALGNCYCPGVTEASGRDERGMWKRSQSASNFVPRKLNLILRLRVPVGWGQGRDCCFQKNILEGQSEAWRWRPWRQGGHLRGWLQEHWSRGGPGG